MNLKNLLVLFVASATSLSLYAQEAEKPDGFGFGFQLVEYQNDFGLGLNVSSPYFLYDNLTVRARGNLMFNQAVIEGKSDWVPYSNFSIGVASAGASLSKSIRLYGEGGVIAILPPDDISAESSVLGGYGLFGFEFFFDDHASYFLEVGGVGSGASADKLPTEPIYSNGLTIGVGFRVTL